MKKINVKSFIAGFLAASMLAAIPVAAARIEAFFTNIRINVDGIDRVSWGEKKENANGEEIPYSLVYHDTVYVPLRAVSELMNKQVYWNGDANTVTIADNPIGKRIVAEKEDGEGNIWEYSTISANDGSTYLKVTDNERGYTRQYLTASNSVYVTNEAVYFARLRHKEGTRGSNQATLIRLPFNNTPDTQDGEELFALYPITADGFAIEGDYAFYAGSTSGNGPHSQLIALNYIEGTDSHYVGDSRSHISNLKLRESNVSKAVLRYDYELSSGEVYRMETTFDKTTGTFSIPMVTEILKDAAE